MDILGYLNWISFLGYDLQSCPNSQKISLNILEYPYISYHVLSYPKISLGANSQMDSVPVRCRTWCAYEIVYRCHTSGTYDIVTYDVVRAYDIVGLTYDIVCFHRIQHHMF